MVVITIYLTMIYLEKIHYRLSLQEGISSRKCLAGAIEYPAAPIRLKNTPSWVSFTFNFERYWLQCILRHRTALASAWMGLGKEFKDHCGWHSLFHERRKTCMKKSQIVQICPCCLRIIPLVCIWPGGMLWGDPTDTGMSLLTLQNSFFFYEFVFILFILFYS